MKISYGITIKDELTEIQRLVSTLLKLKRPEDEIVILFDGKNGSEEVEDYLRANSINNEFTWNKANFEGHFARWKNLLNSFCTGDYILNIDADEYPNEYLITHLHILLEQNPEVDMFVVPRINTVEGITEAHIKQWGWIVNEKGWVNWPDSQTRLYKNKQSIQWAGNVHERIQGTMNYSHLPIEEDWALYHPKTIERQEKQNNYYNTL
jgi:glycosyltransferase involved in cell wall biosynthesis